MDRRFRHRPDAVGGPPALPARPTAADLAALHARRALIVDIRPLGLRQRDGEMAGAVVVDRNQLEWRLDPTSPYLIPPVRGPDQEMVLVCDEGYASSLAAATLQRLGLRRATDLDGGFQAVLALARARASAAPADPVACKYRSQPSNCPNRVTVANQATVPNRAAVPTE